MQELYFGSGYKPENRDSRKAVSAVGLLQHFFYFKTPQGSKRI